VTHSDLKHLIFGWLELDMGLLFMAARKAIYLSRFLGERRRLCLASGWTRMRWTISFAIVGGGFPSIADLAKTAAALPGAEDITAATTFDSAYAVTVQRAAEAEWLWSAELPRPAQARVLAPCSGPFMASGPSVLAAGIYHVESKRLQMG
jgi:hypothetical protein